MTINLKTIPDEDRPPVEMVTLFTIDGREFEIEKEPKANLLLRFLWEQKSDQMVAISNLLLSLLGEGNFKALMEWPDLTTEILMRIAQGAVQQLTGEAEDPKVQAPST